MSELASDFELQLAEMRHAFDAAFAVLPTTSAEPGIDFIALRLGDAPFAIRTNEIAGLHSNLVVTRVPGPIVSLRGIAGFRGDMLPVHDLATLLGRPASDGTWAVIDATNTVALSFSGFEDHFRAPASATLRLDDRARRQYANRAIAHGTDLRPIIEIPSILASIREQMSLATQSKE